MLRAIAENPKLKKRLEKVIHPLVFKEIEKKIRSMKGGKLVLDVPLLLDSPLEEECDLIIGVISSEKWQIARLVERGKDPEKSLAMNRHYPKGKLRKQAGILLATDGKKRISIGPSIRTISKRFHFLRNVSKPFSTTTGEEMRLRMNPTSCLA